LFYYDVKSPKELKLGAVVGRVSAGDEMRGEVGLELRSLAVDVGEVDEESRAHVLLHGQIVEVICGEVSPGDEVAVLEQASASDLLRAVGIDELTIEVGKRGRERTVDALGHYPRVAPLGHERLPD